MKNQSVYVAFDRKKKVVGDGDGTVDVVVYLNRKQRKYISMGKCKRGEWEEMARSKRVQKVIRHCEEVLAALGVLKVEVNTENFNTYYYKDEETAKPAGPVHEHNGFDLDGDFIAYMSEEIGKQQLRDGTRRHKMCCITALKRFGRIKTFMDLTPSKIAAFDEWLRDGTRTTVTIYTYHKNLKQICRKLRMLDLIPSNPYDKYAVQRGKCKEREPLTEKELASVIALRLEGPLAKARDMFVICAYTGLSYADAMAFDFKTCTVKEGKMYYIDGERIKTGNKFFTPILGPAMTILKKYNYQIPQMSDQKVNQYLHLIQALLGLRKSMTFHVARHTFATMVLANDVPIENVARMLGHTDIRTTQIYAKVLNATIERHAEELNNKLQRAMKYNSTSARLQSRTR